MILKEVKMIREKNRKNIMKEIREYLELTQEGFARAVGVSNYTVWRWEEGIIEQPTPKIIKKIMNLIKKKGNEEFKRDFLKFVIYDYPIATFNKSEKELIEEIEKNREQFIQSPVMQKILNEHPEWKDLPFKEIFKRYTKGKISLNASVILNSLPTPPPPRGRPRKIRKNIMKKLVINKKNKTKKKARENKRNKNKNSSKDNKNENSEGSDDETDDYKLDKNLEAKYNLIGFLNLLLKIDMRLNPEKYKRKS
jgi:DNA-binding transcriptional regulator YiaG